MIYFPRSNFQTNFDLTIVRETQINRTVKEETRNRSEISLQDFELDAGDSNAVHASAVVLSRRLVALGRQEKFVRRPG